MKKYIKSQLKRGLSVFTNKKASPKKQIEQKKRILRAEKDFGCYVLEEMSERQALEKALKNAAGGENEKFKAALDAALTTPTKRVKKNIANGLKTIGNSTKSMTKSMADKTANRSKLFFYKLRSSGKTNSVMIFLLSTFLIEWILFSAFPALRLGLSVGIALLSIVMLVIAGANLKIWHCRILFIIMILALALVIMNAAFTFIDNAAKPEDDNITSSVVSSTSSTGTTWQLKLSDYNNNRWFADGVNEIRSVKTDTEATNAAFVWLQRVKTDPNLLVGAAKYLLNQDIDVDKTPLFTKDGWATDKAVQLVVELQLFLGKATIVAQNAPANGYNSGVNDNTVVAAKVPGIKGNTAAVKIIAADGSVYWIMARCGNIVTPEKPDLPPGKTDEQPPTSSTTTSSQWLKPKSSDPADYKKPGDDNTRDAGIGTKPLVPVVSTPAEATPPIVVTASPSTEITAPGASSVVTSSSSSSSSSSSISSSIPKPESGIKPAVSSGSTSSGINSTNPVNPFA